MYKMSNQKIQGSSERNDVESNRNKESAGVMSEVNLMSGRCISE